MISILILTKNEALALPRCLDSVKWSDDVHVFDSGSEDRTCEVARGRGATVTQRAFDNYASQRNAALHGLKFKYPWVLTLDADEVVGEPLVSEISTFVRLSPEAVVAGRIRRRDFFQGRWLKHAQLSPFYIRLVRPTRVQYVREVNEVLVADGDVADLAAPFDHYPFASGLDRWIARHNRYSRMEAEEQSKRREIRFRRALWSALREPDFNRRRQFQKMIFMRLPGRPVIKLLYMIVWRGAWLDGRPGLEYSLLQAFYEYLICLKEREIRGRVQAKRDGSP